MGKFLDEIGITALCKKIKASTTQKTIQTTYAQLKTLRDGKKLVPGQLYRITDFVTTSTQTDTRSAGHPFDIIVVADDEGTLNENAHACLHTGDTYFAGCKLDAWELKYSLDNDTNKFAWADATNGKGVVWWMKDEWNNECFYDFKNIQYKRYKVTAINNPNIPDDAKAAFIYNEETQPFYFGAEDFFGNSFPDNATLDKANPMWVYRFTGYDAVERTWYDMSTKHLSLSADALEFLANDGSGANTVDMCEANKEGMFVNEFFSDDLYYKGRHVLPNNVGYGIHKETWEDGTLNDYSVCEQHTNTFGYNCNYNTFGDYCSGNTFGNYCSCNILGDNCNYNTFRSSCNYNTFGNDCIGNTLGYGCSNNTFGYGCSNNTFGDYCNDNTFGDDCSGNTFGYNCNYNTFGNYLVNDMLGARIQYITIPTATGDAMMQDCVILNGTHGFTDDAKLNISFTPGARYTQYAGLNSSGELKIWVLADLIN